jgi:hypothetical protein
MRAIASKAVTLYAFLLVALALVLAPSAAGQCAMCKEALNPTRSNFSLLANGMFWSIMFMIGMPFTMAAIIVTMIVRSHRRIPPSNPGA